MMSEQPMSAAVTSQNLIDVQNLVTYFPVRAGIFQRVVAWVQATTR